MMFYVLKMLFVYKINYPTASSALQGTCPSPGMEISPEIAPCARNAFCVDRPLKSGSPSLPTTGISPGPYGTVPSLHPCTSRLRRLRGLCDRIDAGPDRIDAGAGERHRGLNVRNYSGSAAMELFMLSGVIDPFPK